MVTHSEFQFPSNGKAHVNKTIMMTMVAVLQFQFPSNGKAHVNSAAQALSPSHSWGDMFQFPSNGKARVNSTAHSMKWLSIYVSIPFKREGTCELTKTLHEAFGGKVSIPFKREGMCELFPPCIKEDDHECFNSLQTGRHV